MEWQVFVKKRCEDLSGEDMLSIKLFNKSKNKELSLQIIESEFERFLKG